MGPTVAPALGRSIVAKVTVEKSCDSAIYNESFCAVPGIK